MTMLDTRPAPGSNGAGDQRRPRLSSVEGVRHRLGDLLPQGVNRQLYDAATGRGYANLSDFLEGDHPLEPHERIVDQRGQPLSVFDHLLYLKQIRSRSSGGQPASLVEAFGQDDEARALFPEWTRRQWYAKRAVQPGTEPPTTRAPALYLSSDYIVGSIQRPYDEDTTLRATQVEPAIPLSEMIARVRGNNGRDYRARRLTQPTAAEIRMLRVAEAAELPKAKILETSSVITLEKYGRALEASYESMRRMPLDDFADYIRLLGVQTEVDQVSAAIDVMTNGDGNPSTAATSYNLTALDSSTTANNLTVAAWIAFLLTWTNPYAMTAVIGQAAAITKLLLLAMPNANLLATALPVSTGIQQSFTPMNTRLAQGQRYGITTDVASGKLLGFDGRFALEHVRENGSQISESDRWITRQTEVLTFSFNEAFAVYINGQAHILNLGA